MENVVWWQLVITIFISYLCGNISFARMISTYKKDDITKLGSGNPGATNILRNYGFKFGVLNLLLDMLKAFVPALASYFIFDKSLVMLYIAGASSMVGHIFPVVWKFKGGKGISSMMGIFLAANPIATLCAVLIGAVIWAIFEYGSVVSFLCISGLSVIEGLRIKEILSVSDRKIVSLILFGIFLFTFYAHRKNIERLLLGKENKAHLLKKKKKLKSKTN